MDFLDEEVISGLDTSSLALLSLRRFDWEDDSSSSWFLLIELLGNDVDKVSLDRVEDDNEVDDNNNGEVDGSNPEVENDKDVCFLPLNTPTKVCK